MASGKFLMLIATFLLTSTIVVARRGANIHKSQYIVKTIKVNEREIVDCIDMYKQPSLNHPLLANHIIQAQPSMEINTSRSKKDKLWFIKNWHKNGHCPDGSIPIIRHENPTHHVKRRHAPPESHLGSDYHQHAVIEASVQAGTIQGIHATLNAWNPTVGPNDFSLSQLWLIAGSDAYRNTMEVGWHVFPYINGDSQTRLFIYWTSDNYQSKGCYDLRCQGFMQTNNQFIIGGAIDHTSVYGGQQAEIDVSILKDKQSGNWWLYVGESPIGYWPQNLFTTLANAGDYVEWGGEVYDSTGGGGHHTSNQMGSGHFPNEGYQKSSYIRGIKYTTTSGSQIQPSLDQLQSVVTIPPCYNLNVDNISNELYLFFGGPGCQ